VPAQKSTARRVQEAGACGTVTVLSPSWASTTTAYSFNPGFQGMWQDPVTGLYYTPNRDYSAALGRWMEADPTGYSDGASLYQSMSSHPETAVDPSGTRAISFAIDALINGTKRGAWLPEPFSSVNQFGIDARTFGQFNYDYSDANARIFVFGDVEGNSIGNFALSSPAAPVSAGTLRYLDPWPSPRQIAIFSAASLAGCASSRAIVLALPGLRGIFVAGIVLPIGGIRCDGPLHTHRTPRRGLSLVSDVQIICRPPPARLT
jgi:RHS repeat-associated protein